MRIVRQPVPTAANRCHSITHYNPSDLHERLFPLVTSAEK